MNKPISQRVSSMPSQSVASDLTNSKRTPGESSSQTQSRLSLEAKGLANPRAKRDGPYRATSSFTEQVVAKIRKERPNTVNTRHSPPTGTRRNPINLVSDSSGFDTFPEFDFFWNNRAVEAAQHLETTLQCAGCNEGFCCTLTGLSLHSLILHIYIAPFVHSYSINSVLHYPSISHM